MAIGLNVVYRDPSREEVYWPYLTQRHLRDSVWPLAETGGLERIRCLEVLGYDAADDLRELVAELEAVRVALDAPDSVAAGYPDRDHVRGRTDELIGRLRDVLAAWPEVARVEFF